MRKTLILIFLFKSTISFSTKFFNNWHCVGISKCIDFSIPYKINVGDMPLVVWKNQINNELISTINICKHMGSRLDNAKITDTGCLKCQYHGLEMSREDKFGEIVEHEGKIFWAFQPTQHLPFSVPFYNNKKFETSFLEIDMDCSLTDSAYNTMDLRHPEYVHNTVVGFGNSIPPENIKYYKYGRERVGMSFDYSSNSMMRTINDNTKTTKNFHMYMYPSFSWSKVSFGENHLIIGVNLLPLGKSKTRWYITLCHNYYTSNAGKEFMKIMAKIILKQDYHQMKNQYVDNDLKKEILFTKIFKDEEPILELKRMFNDYKYPDVDECVKLYKSYIKM
jgi:phenylpropionate dioxygenase-like ring-hydroxylating dioxygenase large terminal subunit